MMASFQCYDSQHSKSLKEIKKKNDFITCRCDLRNKKKRRVGYMTRLWDLVCVRYCSCCFVIWYSTLEFCIVLLLESVLPIGIHLVGYSHPCRWYISHDDPQNLAGLSYPAEAHMQQCISWLSCFCYVCQTNIISSSRTKKTSKSKFVTVLLVLNAAGANKQVLQTTNLQISTCPFAVLGTTPPALTLGPYHPGSPLLPYSQNNNNSNKKNSSSSSNNNIIRLWFLLSFMEASAEPERSLVGKYVRPQRLAPGTRLQRYQHIA